jgi:hypothetical protein
MSQLKQQVKTERNHYSAEEIPPFQKISSSRESLRDRESRESSDASTRVSRGSDIRKQVNPSENQTRPSLRNRNEYSGSTEGDQAESDLVITQRKEEKKRRDINTLMAQFEDGFDYHTPQQQSHLQRSAPSQHYPLKSTVNLEREERKRRNQAGKLGPRLAAASNAVKHNSIMVSEAEDYIGPPPADEEEEVLSTNDSEANGSFQSAATVGSIPVHISQKAKSNHSHFAKSVVSGLGVQGDQAIAAMSVIDRVSNITDEQLRKLDPDTRAQVRINSSSHSVFILDFAN